ncbi:DUF6732 family protein [Donghicola tyrosinivorans]|uniref:Secreted protein with PEP-CTERM sorting signal n=1 Tax=Donghicola tyrosinivorans TaxID=1652492 RepID=A0A2T0WLY3_9RHOB|nr:DUF6732 family protein [Donghicola tyrosinivorans]PRY87713.1 hypothetical protein CLV74_10933 [Donghicola tyrosinivorans]
MKYTTFALLFGATAAQAHTGHDAALSGASHWLLSPMHGLGLIAVAGVLYTLRTARRKE